MSPNERTAYSQKVADALRDRYDIEVVPPRIVLFKVEPDGRLTFQYKQDVRTEGAFQLWCGAVRY